MLGDTRACDSEDSLGTKGTNYLQSTDFERQHTCIRVSLAVKMNTATLTKENI